jgi:hypothetical protein
VLRPTPEVPRTSLTCLGEGRVEAETWLPGMTPGTTNNEVIITM